MATGVPEKYQRLGEKYTQHNGNQQQYAENNT